MSEIFHRSYHSPLHVFVPNTMYMVTASTLHKQHIFLGNERLLILHDALMEVTEHYEWLLQAWAVFSNHYHFVAKSPDNADTLKTMIQRIHSQTARIINRFDGTVGRQVWFQYWDTCLTYEKSYYARLNYVHNNPIKHGLAEVAEQYPFCSAEWFIKHAEPEFLKKVESSQYDQVKVVDDF
jgi:putative transposase